MTRALDPVAYVLGYATLIVLACTTAIALMSLVRYVIDRLMEDRDAQRHAIWMLVDLRTGEVRWPPIPIPREPPLGRRARRRKGQ